MPHYTYNIYKRQPYREEYSAVGLSIKRRLYVEATYRWNSIPRRRLAGEKDRPKPEELVPSPPEKANLLR